MLADPSSAGPAVPRSRPNLESLSTVLGHSITIYFLLRGKYGIGLETALKVIMTVHPDVRGWDAACHVVLWDHRRHPCGPDNAHRLHPVSYTHLRAHETPEHLVCRLLLEKKKKENRRLCKLLEASPK
eukprot:TRINITY_DN21256_c0_g1_i2.p1 TRINITY_DN21256_c0_g1~~TRINITY_DN21256_c0_g1_i2.p1  ORF type:complete len:128 (-),score=12.53 TRINITY_DN21256_c0_g1_i2:61-444(-)